MTGTAIEIRCLGEFAVQGLAVDLRGNKQVALLGYLAANLGTPCAPRDTRVDLLGRSLQ